MTKTELETYLKLMLEAYRDQVKKNVALSEEIDRLTMLNELYLEELLEKEDDSWT